MEFLKNPNPYELETYFDIWSSESVNPIDVYLAWDYENVSV